MDTQKIVVDLMGQWNKPGAPWWERSAVYHLARGHYWLIPTRDRSGPYFLRMWLSPPVPSVRNRGERFESAESLLLHYFFRGDDDQALHDHPWDFSTTILAGGYIEHLPPDEWSEINAELCCSLGPAWNENKHERTAGFHGDHLAADLHCVGHVEPGTFTLVRTGPARRRWGFHPPGQFWIDADEYLSAVPA